MLKWLDVALLGLICGYFVVLSETLLLRILRGQPTGYDQVSVDAQELETLDHGGDAKKE